MTNRMERARTLPPSLPPRGLCRVQAATYIGVSPALFDEMVRDGRMPKPKRINARTVWDIRKLDVAFEAISGDEERNEWDED
jgi:hypothetical protein